MKNEKVILALLATLTFACGCYSKQSDSRKNQTKNSSFLASNDEAPPAPKPLYRDPVHDGAADPSIVFNRQTKTWFMFYTNRRANVKNLAGVEYCHGTAVGMAESKDNGRTWNYIGQAKIPYGEGEYSYWAPEIVYHNNTYHMFLTFVPGKHTDWSGTREIIQLTSHDLLQWKLLQKLDLTSNRCIDAGVYQLPDGTWNLYYKDEVNGSNTYIIQSQNLEKWSKGKPATDKLACEGPFVFTLKGKYWMVSDMWKGLAVYQSDNGSSWKKQIDNILHKPGKGLDDGVVGRHACVVTNNKDQAFIFYFTHPGRLMQKDETSYGYKRSSIQVAELKVVEDQLTCNRDDPTYVNLTPPNN